MQENLENLAKEMQSLSDVRGEFSSDKEFFLYQLSYWQNNWWLRSYPASEKKLTLALARKLTKKSASESDFNSKKELVKKGIRSYMNIRTSGKEREQFRKIVCQKPEIIVKASSKISHNGRKLQRVYE